MSEPNSSSDDEKSGALLIPVVEDEEKTTGPEVASFRRLVVRNAAAKENYFQDNLVFVSFLRSGKAEEVILTLWDPFSDRTAFWGGRTIGGNTMELTHSDDILKPLEIRDQENRSRYLQLPPRVRPRLLGEDLREIREYWKEINKEWVARDEVLGRLRTWLANRLMAYPEEDPGLSNEEWYVVDHYQKEGDKIIFFLGNKSLLENRGSQ